MPEFTTRDVAATTPNALARLMAGPPEALAPWAHAAAQVGVGGVGRDMHRACGWYQRAADLVHPAAVGAVGRFHEDGEVVAQDVDFAFTCYRAAAKAGDGPSMFHYARLLYVRGHVVAAMTWFHRAPAKASEVFLDHARRMLADSGDPVLAAVYPA